MSDAVQTAIRSLAMSRHIAVSVATRLAWGCVAIAVIAGLLGGIAFGVPGLALGAGLPGAAAIGCAIWGVLTHRRLRHDAGRARWLVEDTLPEERLITVTIRPGHLGARHYLASVYDAVAGPDAPSAIHVMLHPLAHLRTTWRRYTGASARVYAEQAPNGLVVILTAHGVLIGRRYY